MNLVDSFSCDIPWLKNSFASMNFWEGVAYQGRRSRNLSVIQRRFLAHSKGIIITREDYANISLTQKELSKQQPHKRNRVRVYGRNSRHVIIWPISDLVTLLFEFTYELTYACLNLCHIVLVIVLSRCVYPFCFSKWMKLYFTIFSNLNLQKL